MTKRKILIGTPIKAGVSAKFLSGFIEILRHSHPELDLDHCFHSGTAVNFARNEICHYARKIKARELVFIDEDMDFQLGHWTRLLSHTEVDIVAGLYPKKLPGRPFWLTNLQEGKEIDPVTGLCEVEEIATGFMKIRVDTVLERMAEEYPENEYYVRTHTAGLPPEGERATSHEFFPMGVMGPRSAGARLERVKLALEKSPFDQGEINSDMDRDDWIWLVEKIWLACYDEQLPGNLFGEDYSFCRRARAIGFKVHADFGMPPIGHIGPATYPITPDMVGLDPESALKEL